MKSKQLVVSIILMMVLTIILCLIWKLNQSKSPIVSVYGEMIIPSNNLQSNAKVDLGRKLFFDKRLSKNDSISCASCHVPSFAFTDRIPFSKGINGNQSMRNAPTLLNVGYQKTLMFDAHIQTLEEQVIVPIQDTNELGISMGQLIEKLNKDEEYQRLANELFNRDFDPWVLTRSLAAFQRSLISTNSRFDRFYYQNDKNALSVDEKAGWKIFSEKLYCTKCHPAPFFTNFKAENNGLYKNYLTDKGRFRIHSDSSEIGAFKVPTLRNITLTYPYMHDGSLTDLADVITHYQRGGEHPTYQSPIITEFQISTREKEQLILFFVALIDTSNVYTSY